MATGKYFLISCGIAAAVLFLLYEIVTPDVKGPTANQDIPSEESFANSITPSTPTQSNQYSQHRSDYIEAFLETLSELYQSTQSVSNAESSFGPSAQSTDTGVQLAALGEIINHLQTAQSYLGAYTDDSDEAISASSKLLWIDIGAELQAATQMKASYENGLQNEDVNSLRSASIQSANFVAARDQLQNDLGKTMQIIKYVIENPSNDPHPSGPIDYDISPDNRSYLLNQIGILFPTPLSHAVANNNVYLLWARATMLILSADTYETQSAVQI